MGQNNDQFSQIGQGRFDWGLKERNAEDCDCNNSQGKASAGRS